MNQLSIKFYLLLLFLCTVSSAVKGISFGHLTSDDGLSQNTAYCMLQDKEGYIWIGTRDGLNRFDGYEFLVYQNEPDNTNSIVDNRVFSLLNDDDNIWIGTAGGLNIFNKKKQIFNRIKVLDSYSLSQGSVYALHLDSKRRVWVGTDGNGIEIYNSKTLEKLPFTPKVIGDFDYSKSSIRAIVELYEGFILIGTRTSGILFYDLSNNTLEQIHTHSSNNFGLRSNSIRNIFVDSKQNVWIASEKNGCVCYNTKTHKSRIYTAQSEPSISDDVVRCIGESTPGTIWIGTLSGLDVLNYEKNEIVSYVHSSNNSKGLTNSSIRSFLFDLSDNMWIGTFYGGLNVKYSSNQCFEFDNGLLHNTYTNRLGIVSCFAQDDKGNLWVGTENNGIKYYATGEDKSTQFLAEEFSDKLIKTLYYEDPDHLWVGTYDQGLHIVDLRDNSIRHFKLDIENNFCLNDNNIYVIFRDSKHRFWIGTSLGGLFRFDPTLEYFVAVDPIDDVGNSLIANTINDIKEGADGTIWIASENCSLVKYNGKGFQKVELRKPNVEEKPLSIRYLTFDSYGNLWAAAAHGIYHLNSKTGAVKHYDRKDGLAGNQTCAIIEDHFDNLWISGINGITKFPLSKQYYLPNKLDTNVVVFTSKDGFQGNEFNRGVCFMAQDSSLLFGGVNGFNKFKVVENEIRKENSRVSLEKLYVLNQLIIPNDKGILTEHINETLQLSLNNDQSSFRIDYLALDYKHADQIQYSYRLVGYDDNWIDNGNSRKAIYSKIPHGEYTFEVKAYNRTNAFNYDCASLTIVIAKPVYTSNLALFCYVLLIVLVYYYLRKWIVYSKYQKRLLLEERAEKKRIKEMDDLKSEFFANVSHQFRTPLTLIAGPIEKIKSNINIEVEEKDYLLSLIDRNVIRLQQLISQLMDFSRLENKMMELRVAEDDISLFVSNILNRFDNFFKQKSLNVVFEDFVSANDTIFFDQRIVENVISIILSNAAKYSFVEGTVKIRISKIEGELIMVFSNTGKQISDYQLQYIFDRFYSDDQQTVLSQGGGTGIGLSFAQKLVELHKGKISAASQDDLTIFTIVIPCDAEAFDSDEFVESYEISTNNTHIHDKGEMSKPQATSILLVEDDMELRTFIKMQLSDYIIYEASDGKSGFKLAKKYTPDIIISDVMMPEMDGVQMCNAIKNHQTTSDIPLILLTAKIAVQYKIEGVESGADIYMEKPFNISLLRANVANLLEQRKRVADRLLSTNTTENIISENEDPLLQKAEAIIKDMINDSALTVEYLSEQLCLSRSQLFRKFKANTSYSPNEFIKITRLKYAKNLLASSKLSVSEVAYDCGFSSPSLFISTFKKQYKVTPKEYAESIF